MSDGPSRGAPTWTSWALLAGVVVAVAVVSVIVIGVLSSNDRVAIAELELGDCFELPEPSESDVDTIETVVTIPCDEPHLAEVVGVGELDASADGENGETNDYPLESDLFDEVDDRCRAAQLDVDMDAFGLLPVIPTEARWERGDRSYLCVAIPFGGEPTTGSALTG